MGLGSGIREAVLKSKSINIEIVSILNSIVEQYSDGNISEDMCKSIAKEIDTVYASNNAQDIRKIEFRIENKKIIAKITFLNVDVPLESHTSEKSFMF